MVLLEVIVEVLTTNPMFILWPAINESPTPVTNNIKRKYVLKIDTMSK